MTYLNMKKKNIITNIYEKCLLNLLLFFKKNEGKISTFDFEFPQTFVFLKSELITFEQAFFSNYLYH